ncbi:MAG: methylated-DNA--[protein]-cysteine S-methyltransferase [Planctomycetes bacterium]|nr:methylated-DNA--[protein]-cysteine S-methyltransferase [Planctomycetota bacterium]
MAPVAPPLPTLPPRAALLRAVAARDASFDGLVYFAVKTTGIFCRPGCPARTPRPDHVDFFATAREASFAGYRPCLRCRPLEPRDAPPAWLAPLLSALESEPQRRWRDADLRARRLDPARVRRWFLRQHGMTFQAYSRARRLGTALAELRRGQKLDAVALDHGFESHSGFRDAFARWFGAPPGRARRADCITFAWIESPLGPLIAAAVDEGLCLLEFTDRRMLEAQLTRLRRRIDRPALEGDHPHLAQLRRELADFFAGRRTRFDVPLYAPGSDFEQRVWQELQRIPCGATRSYVELARAIGIPKAARAVGRANGMNRVAIVIPCHRVIRDDGTLGGYGGGKWRKERLLALERGEAG